MEFSVSVMKQNKMLVSYWVFLTPLLFKIFSFDM